MLAQIDRLIGTDADFTAALAYVVARAETVTMFKARAKAHEAAANGARLRLAA